MSYQELSPGLVRRVWALSPPLHRLHDLLLSKQSAMAAKFPNDAIRSSTQAHDSIGTYIKIMQFIESVAGLLRP